MRLPDRSSAQAAVAGLAVAAMVSNGLALVFTVVFARVLGTDGYGALAACLSAFIVLSVFGSALQVAAAREVAAGRHGTGPELAATVRGWLRTTALAGAGLVVAAVLLREPIAAAIGVGEVPWAAAAVVPSAAVWLGLSLVRGALQGDGQIGVVGVSLVGEALGRLLIGVALTAAGTGVTGALLGTPLAMVAVGAVLLRRLGPPAHAPAGARRLGVLVVSAATPIAALALLMLLQNVDVIVAKHRLDDDAAGAYAAAAVAAKVLIWVAVGLSGYVVPEAARRAARGEPALAPLRLAAGLIAVLAVPVAVIFALVPSLLLELAFGAEYTAGADALLPLGAAMALLACALLGTQYLLALHRARFLVVLAAGVLVEVVALAVAGSALETVALVVLAAQAVTAAGVLAAVLATRTLPAAEAAAALAGDAAGHEAEETAEAGLVVPARG